MKMITVLSAVGMLALAACGGSSYSSGSSSSSSSTKTTAAASTSAGSTGGSYGGGGYGHAAKTTTASTSSSAKVASGSNISITMHDDYFGTKVITGKPGATVKVTLSNAGHNEHNFKIDGQKAADADVPPGKTATATVIIPKSGSVQFYCEYHKGLGMVGTVKAV